MQVNPLPLPLTNGALIVDNSMLEVLQTCPRKFEYKYLLKRMRRGRNAALDFGSAIHAALEWRYKNCREQAPTIVDEEAMNDIVTKFFEEHPIVDEEERRTPAFAADLLREYNKKYQNEPFHLLEDTQGEVLAEMSFAIKLFDYETSSKDYPNNSVSIPVIFSGKIDLPIMYDGSILVMDTKTGGMMWGPQKFCWEHQMTKQFAGYGWAFEKLTGKKCDGYMLNAIVTKSAPIKPKSGTVSDWYQQWMPRDIQYFALNPSWREEWLADTIASVNYLFWLYQQQYFPASGMYTKACAAYNGCEFREVCQQPIQQRLRLLQDHILFEDNTWSPLKQTTTKQTKQINEPTSTAAN